AAAPGSAVARLLGGDLELIQQVLRAAAAEARQPRLPSGGQPPRRDPLVGEAAELVAAEEDVDRPLDVLVLVRRIAPREARAVLALGVEAQQQIRQLPREARAVPDMHLHASA